MIRKKKKTKLGKALDALADAKKKRRSVAPSKEILINKDGFRKDLDDYFKKYMFTFKKQTCPFVVVNQTNHMVSCLKYTKHLFDLPNDSTVLHTWPGKYRSDVFVYTIEEMHEWLKDNPSIHSNVLNLIIKED